MLVIRIPNAHQKVVMILDDLRFLIEEKILVIIDL